MDKKLHEKAKRKLSELEALLEKEIFPEIRHLRRLITRDELTGVLNRRGINEEMGALFKEVAYLVSHEGKRRFDAADLSVLFIDCDNFKKINDAYGHDAGDKVLKGVAATLAGNVRAVDLVGRWGGEEFAVALLGASEEEAYRKAERIRKEITRNVAFKRHPHLVVTASIGVASLRQENVTTLKALIAAADEAMYEAKHNRGKNTVVRRSELQNLRGR